MEDQLNISHVPSYDSRENINFWITPYSFELNSNNLIYLISGIRSYKFPLSIPRVSNFPYI
jgi:hypothetical protein